MLRGKDRLPFLAVPAYQPNSTLFSTLLKVSKYFNKIIVVNDGSSCNHDEIFSKIETISNTVIIRHSSNLGKGAALKTAFKHYLSQKTLSCGIVTMDADGQHDCIDVQTLSENILNNSSPVYLGVRKFTREIPWKSYIGNLLTSFIYRILTASKLSDTQTGLRALPKLAVGRLLKIKCNHYDFELEMLLNLQKSGWLIIEIPIKTIYINNNSESHFHSIIDSAKVYFVLVKFFFNSTLPGIFKKV